MRRLALLLTALGGLAGCGPGSGPTEDRPPAAHSSTEDVVAADSGPSLFADVTSGSGLSCRPRNGEEASLYTILETVGSGLALLDYDGDGRLDVFACGGGFFEGDQVSGCPNRLFRNLGGWHFRDVTSEVGLDGPPFYSHGCAVADYDRDGWPDLLVTGYRGVALYHNVSGAQGRRRFQAVTAQAGLGDSSWATSAAWGDLDGDGYPDLYVCHYLDWSLRNNPSCTGREPDVPRDVCTPHSFAAVPHALYHNNGNGTFSDVSRPAGLRHHSGDDGKGLGVLIADLNGDGRPDVYVTCDTTDSLLYVNRGGRLEECGLLAGVARDEGGLADGSMGVDAADWDGSGRPSLWVTNFEDQMHSLFRNLGPPGHEHFLHWSRNAGIARLGRSFVGWGTGFLDFDNDGWEDLVVANGHVFRHARGGMGQRAVLLQNRPPPRPQSGRWFEEVSQRGGYFALPHRGRGLVVGDLDNDGYPDLVVSHVNEPVSVLRNQAERSRAWLGVELVGRKRRDVAGATVTLEVDGRRLTRFAKGGGSYLSSGDRRLLFGLGGSARVGRLTVRWPFGRTEHWDALAPHRYHRLEEGTGKPG